jgi:hypothetical protein
MCAHPPLFRRLQAFALGSSLALLLGPLPAFADQDDGRYDLPDHALAAGDEVGSKLFDTDWHVVLRPRHEEKARPQVEPARNQLPAWPAKWAPPEGDEY